MAVDTTLPESQYGSIEVAKVSVPDDHVRGRGNVEELKQSIATEGLLQPILVRQVEGGFELIAGLGRLDAVRDLGWDTIPAHVRDADAQTRLVLRTVENVQRHQLHPLDEAREYDRLITAGLDTATISKRVGRSMTHVTARMALLTLPESMQKEVAEVGGLTIGEAVELARLSAWPELQAAAYQAIKDDNVPASTAVSAELTRAEQRTKVAATAASVPPEKLFTGQVGRDGFLFNTDIAPGELFWPAEREYPADAKVYVDGDGESWYVTDNPLQYLNDPDPRVAKSAQDLVSTLQPGTIEQPAQAVSVDEAEKLRRSEENKHFRKLKKRDELREQHTTDLVRKKAVKGGDVSDLIFRGFLDSLTQAQREVVYAKANVPKVERTEGFGEQWDVAAYLQSARGSWLRLAYAAMLQVAEDVIDGAVKQKTRMLHGDQADRATRYLEHLQSTGYLISEEEAELAGLEADTTSADADEEGEDSEEG